MEGWALTKDYIPIEIRLNLELGKLQANSRRFALQKLDHDKLRRLVKELKWETSSDPLKALQEGIREALL